MQRHCRDVAGTALTHCCDFDLDHRMAKAQLFSPNFKLAPAHVAISYGALQTQPKERAT
jgi:hypothetical protein